MEVASDRGSRHAGVEFLLLVATDRFQVQADGRASQVPAGSRVTVTGRLELVGEYEWDAFQIEESRAEWLVKALAPAGDDDVMLDLVALSSG